MFFDVHAHLTHESFKNDLPDVVKRASDVVIHCAGSGLADNQEVLRLANSYSNVKACLGLYPWDAVSAGEDVVDLNTDFIKSHADKLVCIGEVGLDHYEHESGKDWDFQEWVFDNLLELAEGLSKPVLIHSRKAEARVLELLQSRSVKSVIHCFTGSHSLIPKFLEQGCFFSVPASVVRDGGFQSLVSKVPVERLLTETDSPFMAPVAGGRSEPVFVKDSVKKIAELKGLTLKKCEAQLTTNYKSLFL